MPESKGKAANWFLASRPAILFPTCTQGSAHIGHQHDSLHGSPNAHSTPAVPPAPGSSQALLSLKALGSATSCPPQTIPDSTSTPPKPVPPAGQRRAECHLPVHPQVLGSPTPVSPGMLREEGWKPINPAGNEPTTPQSSTAGRDGQSTPGYKHRQNWTSPCSQGGGFKVSQPTNEQRKEQGTGHPPPSYLQAATAAVPHASHTTSILGSCRAR